MLFCICQKPPSRLVIRSDGLVQVYDISTAEALEIPQSCPKASLCYGRLHSSDVFSNCVPLTFLFSFLCFVLVIYFLLSDAFKHISYKHVGNHMNWEQFVLSFYLPVFKLGSTGVFQSVFSLEKHQYSALWCFQAHILLLCGEPYELRAALTITMTEHNTAVTSLLVH